MGTIFLIVTGLIVGLLIFEFIRKKPYHAMSVYYAGMFIKRWVLPGTRVRETVVIQLMLFAVCLFMAYMGNRSKRNKLPAMAQIPCIKIGMLVVGSVVFLELINGYFSGYAFFSMMVDVYKVVEMFLFYFMLTYIWRTTKEMEKGIDLLAIEMCVFGVVEMFITERGGVGLNMLMSLTPIIFALGFYTHKKRFWLIIVCSFAIILASKTRTYLFGFILSILLIFFFANGKRKLKIALTGCAILIIGAGLVSLYAKNTNSSAIQTVIDRFLELSGGFEEAGGYRVYEMRTAWQKFLESPFIGKGYGYLEFLYIEKQGHLLWGDFMHNAYLEVLTKTGIVGACVYGASLIGYTKRQYKEIRRSRKDKGKETGFLIGGLAGTFCWLFIYFAAPLSSYGYVFIPGIIGLLYSQLSKRETEQK